MVRGFFVLGPTVTQAAEDVVSALALGKRARHSRHPLRDSRAANANKEKPMRKWLLTVGFLALALGLLWIGQGTGAIAWPQSSFMINQIQWAGYGAALAALGLILIWQGKR
jgi:hypothetical protein